MSNPTLPTPTSNPGSPRSTLEMIEIKVRKLTQSLSPAMLSQSDIYEYVNTFVVYDFPEILRTFNLRTEFSFYTNPGQDVYNTDEASFAGAISNPLYNFQNLYITVHPPVYCAGYELLYSQSPEQFYSIYPRLNSIALTATQGNGTAGPFTGVINAQQAILPPSNIFQQQVNLLQSNVLFSAIGTPGLNEIVGMAMVDVPIVDAATGFKINIGNLYNPNDPTYQAALRNPPTVVDANNNINYITGAYVVNFPQVTVAGTRINSEVVPLPLTMPQAIMYHNNQFTVRPVPDQSYRVSFQVYQRPTALLSSSQKPELEEYWQMIAYGAAKKIFEDRMDLDSVQLITPEFEKQILLCERRTIVQLTNQRAPTIYDQNNNQGTSGWGWPYGGGF